MADHGIGGFFKGQIEAHPTLSEGVRIYIGPSAGDDYRKEDVHFNNVFSCC